MVVSHITMKKVVVIPANDSRIHPDPVETVLDVTGGDRVEGTTYVQEGSKAV